MFHLEISGLYSSAAEPCGSSILSLVQDIDVDYKTKVSGIKVAQYIIAHYSVYTDGARYLDTVCNLW